MLERVGVEAGMVTRLVVRLETTIRTFDSLVVAAPVLTIDPEGTEFGTAIAPDQVWGGRPRKLGAVRNRLAPRTVRIGTMLR